MNWSIGMSMKSPRLSVFGALCLMTSGLACGGTPPPPPDSALVADPPPSDGTPGEGLSEMDRGIAYVAQEEWEEAKVHFDEAIASMPKNGEAHYYLAVTQLNLGHAAAAEESFRKAVELDSDLYLARAQLGALYAGSEPPRCEQALEVLLPALESIPDKPEEKSLRADTESYVGFCFWDGKKYEEATTHYEASLAAEDLPNTRLALGSMLLEAKKNAAAVPHFEAYAKTVEKDPKQLVKLGQTLARAGAPDKCVEMLDKAIALDEAKVPLLIRGRCKLQNEDAEGARGDFTKALELDNRFQDAYFFMGVAWLESNNRPKAAEAFQQVIRIDKTTKVAKAAQQRLESLAKKR